MEHTLKRQNAELTAKVDKLTALVEQQANMVKQMVSSQLPSAPPVQIAQINNGQITNNTVNVTANIIQPWDGDQKISVTAEMIVAAFEENPRLAEYCKMNDREKTNPEGAGPYVLEALLDLTKRAHQDPMARNVYLNPKRADQVMVCLVNRTWEVRSLEEATRMMFDGVAMEIKRVVRSDTEREKLPFPVQGSASYVPMMYEDEQDKFVTLARKPVSAHLTNTAPNPNYRPQKVVEAPPAEAPPG